MGSNSADIQTADLSKKPQSEKPRGLKQMFSVNRQDWMEAVKSDPAHTFFVGDFRAAKILAEAKRHNQSLNSILKGDIQLGVSSDFAEMHVVPKEELRAVNPESDCVRKSISGQRRKPLIQPPCESGTISLGRGPRRWM